MIQDRVVVWLLLGVGRGGAFDYLLGMMRSLIFFVTEFVRVGVTNNLSVAFV